MYLTTNKMSLNQWKLLNYIRETVNKIANEPYYIKDITNHVINKIPLTLSTHQVVQFVEDKVLKKISHISRLQPQGNVNDAVDRIKPPQNETIKDWKKSEVTLTNHNEIDTIHSNMEAFHDEDLILSSVEKLILLMKSSYVEKSKAVKSGTVRHLLKLRTRSKNQNILEACREALVILGYTDPLPSRGVRILSIDGGGVRGLLVLEMLKKLEELTGKRVHELFDYFCGVSTGSIICFAMGVHLRPIDEIIASYEALSKEVFKQSAVWGTGNLMWSHAYYDTTLWESKLKSYLGTDSLISTSRNARCPKISCISAVVNQSELSAFVFRNYSLPWRFQSQYSGSYNYEVWQAARASAAAPTYFHEFKLGSLLHQDGGILVNNPTAIAVHEAKLLWPEAPIQCVVSFGTGRTVPSPTEINKLTEISNSTKINSIAATSWARKFYKILDSATDTEAVHTVLGDLLPTNVYYRFNPYLTEMIGMVENNPKKLEQLKRDALMYLRRNEDKFQEAAKTLTFNKTYLQRLKDDVRVRRDMYGI